MSKLNQAQKEAIEYLSGPLLIVAGAGTGKTTVITEKIAYLIRNNLAKPEEILAITFTEKSAEEMAERVGDLLETSYSDVTIGTFHAFCQRLLEQYGLNIGLPNHFKVLTATDTWLLVREHWDKFKLDYYRPLANPTRHIHELIRHFAKCKDELITPREYLEHAENVRLETGDMNVEEGGRLTEVANAYHAYNQLLLHNNSLDFGDLIFYAIELLRSRPAILSSLQKKYRYVLVDEFQDVNWAQYSLVRLLAGEHNQLSVVGDDDQAIYAFRGASVANILRFKDDFPLAHEIVLGENYRSSQKILDTAYELIAKNNPDRLEAKLHINKRLQSMVPWRETGVVEHMHLAKATDEVAAVVEEIIALKNSASEAAWGDSAILVRANNHAEPFVNALEKRGVPYEFLASSGLFRQPIVLDALSFFKLLDSYQESSALFRLLCLPVWGCNPTDIHALTHYAKKKSISYYEALQQASLAGVSKEGLIVAEKIFLLIERGLKQAVAEKPSRVLYQFLDASGYLEYLKHQEESNDSPSATQARYLKQFFEYLADFEAAEGGSATVRQFLRHYTYVLESGDEGTIKPREDADDRVEIMTIHAAKGLEFKNVFVVNMVEDRFPSRRRSEGIEIPPALIREKMPTGDAHIQEERRLCYVAMTRAKERLYLTSAGDYGGVRFKKMSRFLIEAGFTELRRGTELANSSRQIRPFHQGLGGGQNDYQIPTAFSFSQIRSYETCPYQYKLGSVMKIPVATSNASLTFGQTIHRTLQKFYERLQAMNQAQQVSLFSSPPATPSASGLRVPSMTELLDLYEESWSPDWFESAEQRQAYHKEGKQILRAFYASNEGSWSVPVILEGWFKIPIGSFFIQGRIDRIDRLPDGTLEIIDYKTGEPKEKLATGDKDQLLMYQLAAEKMPEYRHLGAPSKLTFYYLNNSSRISFFGTPKDVEQIQEKMTEIIERIRARDFTPTPSPFVCRRCDFREICEFRLL